MAVYFVYRSQYNTPALNYIRQFPEKNLFEWFCKHWKKMDDNAVHAYCDELFGIDVYGYDSLLTSISDNDIAKPKSQKELEEILVEHMYYEGAITVEPHLVQVLTDDDELDIVYYLFDDDYLRSNPGKADFLLQSNWELPEEFSDSSDYDIKVDCEEVSPSGSFSGNTFCVFLTGYAGGNISDISANWCIEDLRIPQLGEYLLNVPLSAESIFSSFPVELCLLREQLLVNARLDSSEFHGIEKALKDCSADSSRTTLYDWVNTMDTDAILRGKSNDAQIALVYSDNSKIQVSPHMLQISIYGGKFFDNDYYDRWIIFDDLWASKNKSLADCILRYGSRWDVLADADDD